MSFPSYIGIAGPMGSGKTTTARMICKSLSGIKLPMIIPFAYPLKKVAEDLGWDGVKDERGRKLLQQVGTEVGRAYDPELWVTKWAETLGDITRFVPDEVKSIFSQDGGPVVVIADDVRFQNEADFIRHNAGMLIHITRKVGFEAGLPAPAGGFSVACTSESTHESERGIFREAGEYLLENNSDLEYLDKLVDAALTEIIRKRGL